MARKSLAIIGCGNMGGALLQGLVSGQVFSPQHVVVCDPKLEKRRSFEERLGVRCTDSLEESIATSDIVLLAVKPQVLEGVLEQIGLLPQRRGQFFLSVAAGVEISFLERKAGREHVFVRAMPNLPAVIGSGMSAYYAPDRSYDADVERILGAVGCVIRVEREHDLDAVTGVAGSGPAYVAIFIEALADAAVRMGLGREHAITLAAQTVRGSASLILEEGWHPASLKDRVSSPAGTTVEGLEALERSGFRNAVIQAVTAATRRAEELRAGG